MGHALDRQFGDILNKGHKLMHNHPITAICLVPVEWNSRGERKIRSR